MKTKLILFAEDSPHDVEMTLNAFAAHNLVNEIVVVNDGAEALDFLFCRGRYADRSTGNPALVVLDVKMPKVDGLEVLREIRANARLRPIPVVMLTSSREQADILRGYELGTNAYVVKPVDFHSFIEAVKQLGAFWMVHNEPHPSLR
jgi:CheY-like chemotaxis protein